MKLVSQLPLGIRLCVAALAAIGFSVGVAHTAGAQVPDLSATITPDPSSALPGTTVEVTAVFTPESTLPNYDVSITLSGTAGSGTIAATPVSATSGLTGCVVDGTMRSLSCDWDSNTDTAQTLVVAVNVAADATPRGWDLSANAAPDGERKSERASANLVILAVPPTTAAPTTAAPTTAAPTTAAPTTAVDIGAELPSTGPRGARTAGMALAASLLVLVGGALVVVRRRA